MLYRFFVASLVVKNEAERHVRKLVGGSYGECLSNRLFSALEFAHAETRDR